MIDLEDKFKKILETFQPSTTFAEGELLNTNYRMWNEEIVPKQIADWEKIKRQLRGTWGKLNWKYRGWIFNQCRAKYNWRGWSTEDGVAVSLALQKVKA